MDKKLKQFLVKSIVVLLLIHLAYFIYGYFKFAGLKDINIYTEFYRFKFYDDVSISHFFVSGLFLFFFLIFLLRNHTRQGYSFLNLLKIGGLILLISFLSFSFFISYSFGLNAKLKSELPEADFNADKTLLNVLNSFLYNYTSYSSEKLFNPENILYPKPYPVIKATESIDYGSDGNEYSVNEYTYFSIDTLKVLTSTYEKVNNKADSIFDILGFDKEQLKKRIISKKAIKDSTEIIFKGREINPDYDEDICIFLQNKKLYAPIQDLPVEKQQYDNAVKRYKLLYKYKADSLLYTFQKLDTVLKKYNIETQINPKLLAKDAFYYRDHNREPLNGIRNTYDRAALKDKFNTLEKLFYKPNYLHPSIALIFFTVIVVVWLILFLLYVVWNPKKKNTSL
ncbi:hypothetical protein [Flavobacterium sp. ENC]|uniref:hypothetical protein n=1 Tax=Flavobacterium sp. ENC TaxID=2897330 RepID=UPI001E43148D|nr:hypothetical protein [Flavobacterium sp. ENC]MCD0467121.1 hypothetical protein [Flavobacterium sp. ENC]